MPSPAGSGRREHAAAFIVAIVFAALAWTGWSSDRAGDPADGVPTAADAALPADPSVMVDSLPNGLRYYLRENRNPKNAIELRLVVDAGSVLERDDQRGLAHGVEHMAFRGTERFAHQALVAYLQSIGLRDGDDLNAYTAHDETVYRLTIPTDRPGALERGFEILEDWSRAVTFDSADAAEERGVVLAERRTRRNAAARLDSARDALFLAGSPYAERQTIGTLPTLERFDPGAMRRYYQAWYRPDLMAVVAVGSVSEDSLRRLVERHFGGIARRPGPERVRPTIAIPDTARAVVLTDPETRGATVSVWHLEPRPAPRTVADFRARIVEELYSSLLDDRLAQLNRQPGSVILSAGAERETIVRPLRGVVARANVAVQAVPRGLDAVLAELARVERDGFTLAELDRRRKILLGEIERDVDDDERAPSSDLADDYVANRLHGEPMLSSAASDGLYARILPQITVGELRAAARRLNADAGRVIVVTAPPGTTLPSAPSMLALADSVRRRPLPRYADQTSALQLMANAPEPGRIVGERIIPDVGVTEWTLGNGMRVLLKPTSRRAEQILVDAWAPGGASLASDASYRSAYMSDVIVDAMGLGAFDHAALGRQLEGHTASLSPYVYDDVVGVSGEGTSLDAETLFQLLNMYFTAPRADSAAFRAWLGGQIEHARDRAVDPDAAFHDSIAVLLGQHRARSEPPTVASVRRVDERAALAFYRARFGNASNFTVLLVGSLTPDRLRQLVLRYLASLPAGTREAPRDDGTRYPTGIVVRTFARGREAKATAHFAFTGAITTDAPATQLLMATRDLLARALEARLRNALGGTYGVEVDASVAPAPRHEYTIEVEFTTAPEQVDSLTQAMFSEIARLREQGPTAAELAALKAAEAREARDALESNESWRDEIRSHTRSGWPLATILTHPAEIERFDAATLRDAARRFIDPMRYVKVIRLPSPKI